MDTTLDNARELFPPLWVIYAGPRDYPGLFVVRVWFGEVCEPRVFKTDTLEGARHYCIRHGACCCLSRDVRDDPVIVETWV